MTRRCMKLSPSQWPNQALGQSAATAAELRTAAEYAHAAGDEALRVKALDLYLVQLRPGPTPVGDIARELDAIESEEPGPYLQAAVDEARGNLAMFAGQFDEGRLLMQRRRRQLEALKQTALWAHGAVPIARLELAAGNAAAARDVLLEADSILAASGGRGPRSYNKAWLAVAYQQLGTGTRHWPQ